ncbi:hypothetical protein K437DRAFT_274364 [Tilletiaria anomala UBC 951]|uniref:Uncharacterized protein n=1 Tax=Tilletiaria anomala (strain ATCC 24038 / CBS 436.72 / UBC 951) TaxID=1037660 RepID=A0A066VTY3_TILAU|nr:uncharacterized protein K437DRAFT_274364 [Tilletiaria anomala UBC 951]KDN44916.1 hypothetical protein K437DRAFT_274364 [Tilletiaria anomala UBC 951]
MESGSDAGEGQRGSPSPATTQDSPRLLQDTEASAASTTTATATTTPTATGAVQVAPPYNSADSTREEGSLKSMIAAHGRPLSIIESVGSVGSDDGDYEGDDSLDRVTDVDISYDNPASAHSSAQPVFVHPADVSSASSAGAGFLHPESRLKSRQRRPPKPNSTEGADVSLSTRRSYQELEAQVHDLFDRFAHSSHTGPHTSTTESSSASEAESDGADSSESYGQVGCSRKMGRRRYLLTGDLPAVLAEFESFRTTQANPTSGIANSNLSAADAPLIDPALLPQIEAFANENPNLRIQPAMLVNMITSLQSAYSEAGSGVAGANAAGRLSGEEIVDVRQILSDSSQMSSGDDSADEDDSDISRDSADGGGGILGRRESITALQLQCTRDDREETPVPSRGGNFEGFDIPPTPSAAQPSSGDEDVIGKDYSASLATSASNVSSSSVPRKRSSQDFPANDIHQRSRQLSRERKVSTSARSQPGCASSGEGSQPRSRKSSGVATHQDEKEILKGKGRARVPPSAWTRPKPKVLAQRTRRTSDTSSSAQSLTESPQLGRGSEDAVGLGRPAQRRGNGRSRQASQPVSGYRDYDNEDSAIPRSASTGYIFPRTINTDLSEGQQEEDLRFDELSAALSGQSPRFDYAGSDAGSTGRGASPGLDESSFVPFSFTPSASFNDSFSAETPLHAKMGQGQGGLPRGISSPDIYGRGAMSTPSNKLSMLHSDLMRENERLKREKKDLQESMQAKEDDHEAVTADLHSRLDTAEEQLTAKRREEKEASARAEQFSEQVSSLESELAAVQKRNKGLEELNQKGREQIESNLAELELLRKQLEELRQAVRAHKVDEAHAQDTATAASAEVARLKDLVAEKEQRILHLLELEAENDRLVQENLTLSEQVGKLKAELDEKFRSLGREHDLSFDGHRSLQGTPSQRLGAELRRHFSPNDSLSMPTREECSNGEGQAADPDTSAESYIETVTRHVSRSKKGKAKARDLPAADFIDVGTQPSSAEDEEAAAAETSILSDGKMVDDPETSTHTLTQGTDIPSPPTYDEAALEKTIIDRLHPGAIAIGQKPLDEWPEYATLSKLLDLRCDVLENKMLLQARPAPILRAASGQSAQKPSTVQLQTVISNLRHHGLSSLSIHQTSFYMGALAFLLGVFFTRTLLPSQHHYHFGPYMESAAAWRDSNSFMLPPGTHTVEEFTDPRAGWLSRLDLSELSRDRQQKHLL